MSAVQIHFVGEISEQDVAALYEGENVTTKLILSLDDFALFRYREGDKIEVESREGYRLQTQITSMEIVKNAERAIIILSLSHAVQPHKMDLTYKCSSA